MSKIYRLGVIGFAHMHINSLIDYFLELQNIEWVACADTIPEVPSISLEPGTRRANIKYAVEKTGMKLYEDYKEMLEKENFDIVLFCPENARHGEVAEAIARKKVSMMITEKPMAATLSEALRMVRSAYYNGVELVVNWPTTWSPAIRKVKELIDTDEIGAVWQVKWRNGASMGPLAYGQKITEWEKGQEWWHQEKTGGGALLDYCCYGACLSRWFLGEPATSAFGIRANFTSHYGDADDNAVILVRFPSSMAILEATWSTVNTGVPSGPIIYGTTGTIVVDYGKVLVFKDRKSKEPTTVFEDLTLPEGRETLAKESTMNNLESIEHVE